MFELEYFHPSQIYLCTYSHVIEAMCLVSDFFVNTGVSQPGGGGGGSGSLIPLEEALCDAQRVAFFQDYLKELLRAIRCVPFGFVLVWLVCFEEG